MTLYVIQDRNLYPKTYKMHIAYTCISQDTDRSVSQTSVRVHIAISRALSHDRGRYRAISCGRELLIIAIDAHLGLA